MRNRGPVRLVFDASRCEGHAICALRCPERISLDEWGFAEVDPTPTDDELGAVRARRAARACPAGALTVVAVPAPAPRRRAQSGDAEQT